MIKKTIRDFLIDFAQSNEAGDFITYKDLVRRCHLPMLPRSKQLSEILSLISTEENEDNGTLLSVLVCNSRKKRPGKGFYHFASELRGHIANESQFYKEESKKVYAYWHSHKQNPVADIAIVAEPVNS